MGAAPKCLLLIKFSNLMCQKWHINRLFTLVKVCKIKNETPKKMSQREIMNQNAALNAARRKRLHTNG